MSTPGAKMFSSAGFVARIPISMVTLGIVLLVEGRSGSYGLAGAVSASYMVASAVSSPVIARLVDRHGQDRILVPCFVLFAVGMLGLVLSVDAALPTPVPHLCAAFAGAFYPPIGSCVRARWAHALGPGPRLHTAYAFEAVVDESIFIVGPVIVTLLAIQVSPMAAIVAVMVCALVGGLWFGALRSTQPDPAVHDEAAARAPLRWRWLTPMALAAGCLGSLFGASEVVTVAFADEAGRPSATAVLLALWAAGSLIAGLITGAVRWRATPLQRYRAGATGMALVMMPLPFIDNIVVLGVVLFFAGFAISPTLVAAMALVEANVPASRLTEGMTWVTTGLTLGLAPGAAVAGALIDEYGASTAYLVPAVSGVLAALVALLTGASSAMSQDRLEAATHSAKT
jgi:MFS family permease